MSSDVVTIGDSAEKLQQALGISQKLFDGKYSFYFEETLPFSDKERAAFQRAGKTPPTEESWDLTYHVDVVIDDSKLKELVVRRTETF